jgi:hypothetical protein
MDELKLDLLVFNPKSQLLYEIFRTPLPLEHTYLQETKLLEESREEMPLKQTENTNKNTFKF